MPLIRCLECDTTFKAKSSDIEYCSDACEFGIKICSYCCKEFISSNQKYCSAECFDKSGPSHAVDGFREIDYTPTESKVKTKGDYVYGWFDNDGIFYIGRGCNNRAWERHINSSDGTLAKCETLRINSKGFYVRILKDNLTLEGAILIESVLIDLLRPYGNINRGTSRQERPPLELS